MTTHEHTDQPMRHRMVVFGHDTMFMSHLPMFSMREHAYQVILETELSADDGPFTHGSGPAVSGSTLALVMVMAGMLNVFVGPVLIRML